MELARQILASSYQAEPYATTPTGQIVRSPDGYALGYTVKGLPGMSGERVLNCQLT